MSEISYARIPTEAIDIAEANLNKSEFRIWLYLWKVDAFGDKMRVFPTPEKIGEALNLHTRTVARACDKLEDVGLFKFKIKEWQGINSYGSKSEQAKKKLSEKIQTGANTNSGCCDSAVQKMTERSNFGQTDPNRDSAVQKMTERSKIGSFCQNQGSKVASEETFTPSNNSINNSINNSSLINSLIKPPNNFEREERLGNLDQENSEEEFLRDEVLQETDEMPVAINSENAESGNKQIEKPVKPQRQAEPENLHSQNSNREATLNIQNLEDGQGSAAAPSHFFANLSEFVIHEAKEDPAIKSPEIWARTCLKRNPEEWQAKWDKWERDRAITTTYKPEVFTPPDPEVARRAIEEARRLLPEWMRRNCG